MRLPPPFKGHTPETAEMGKLVIRILHLLMNERVLRE